MGIWGECKRLRACLHALAVRADDEGPSARRDGHAHSVMCDVVSISLALLMERVMG